MNAFASFQLPTSTRMGPVRLRVRDASACLRFYRNLLGAQTQKIHASTFYLWAPDSPVPLVILEEDPLAAIPPRRSTGLFHLAIRLPRRRDLGTVLVHLLQHNYPLQGFSDHGVSEALYMSDPEGNGVELYRDRPPDQWPYHHGELAMVTRALDVEALLKETGSQRWNGFPAGSEMGHVHLKVSQLEKAEAFYHRGMGFRVTQRSYPGALFFAAGAYHHHLGANIWESRGASPPPQGAAGLINFSVQVETAAIRDQVVDRLESTFSLSFQERTYPFGHALLGQDLDHIGVELLVVDA